MKRTMFENINTNNSTDNYQTPFNAIDIIIPFLNKKWIFWECAEGNGNITKRLFDKGFKVIGSDILIGRDFLKWQQNKYDCIITNPPFSIKNKFLERAFNLNKPFAFLVPLTILESNKRQENFKKYKNIQLIIPNKRINFILNNKVINNVFFLSIWLCYKFNLDNDINFVNIK